MARTGLLGHWACAGALTLALAGVVAGSEPSTAAPPPKDASQVPAATAPSPANSADAAPQVRHDGLPRPDSYRSDQLGQHPLYNALDRDPLRRPLESPPEAPPPPAQAADEQPPLVAPFDPPSGFAGQSGVLPRDTQADSDFVPVEDRWRVGFPDWDRYGKGHPPGFQYPFELGQLLNPYTQNVLKGDYPILGQNTFLDIDASSLTFLEARQIPTNATSFESTTNPHQQNFFGRPNQFFYTNYFSLSADLFHGDAAFKPVDWRVRITPVFDINDLNLNELGVVSPDVRKGAQRTRTFLALEEWFLEAKLADLSPNYDFVSVRAGSQFFNNDFRGFLLSETNRAVRLFGTLEGNRDQFNLVYFDMLEKDTNSELNTFHDRDQQVLLANFYRQDFIWPGYTAQCSVVYNHDEPSFLYNKNNFLVRPDPVGVFQPHELNVAYVGWAGDGHINRFNITHQFYWALGHDSLNPLANQPQDINAQFAAVELSYDRDYVRFRTSFLWSSGDSNINNRHATGFDTILDNPNFAGGQFSYWQREAIPLFGVNLVNAGSLVPDLRSSKIQGQSNFVNPGLFLFNLGLDIDVTPKIKLVNNVNFLWFDETEVLEQFVFQAGIHHFIGVDLSSGVIYRPLLSNNVIVTAGISTLIPGIGFDDLYSNQNGSPDPLVAGFLQLNLNF